MPRCLHIYDSGFQCIDESVPEGGFCEDHCDWRAFDRLDEPAWPRLFRRFVALVLLIIFLVPLLYSLRQLYWGSPSAPLEAR